MNMESGKGAEPSACFSHLLFLLLLQAANKSGASLSWGRGGKEGRGDRTALTWLVVSQDGFLSWLLFKADASSPEELSRVLWKLLSSFQLPYLVGLFPLADCSRSSLVTSSLFPFHVLVAQAEAGWQPGSSRPVLEQVHKINPPRASVWSAI